MTDWKIEDEDYLYHIDAGTKKLIRQHDSREIHDFRAWKESGMAYPNCQLGHLWHF